MVKLLHAGEPNELQAPKPAVTNDSWDVRHGKGVVLVTKRVWIHAGHPRQARNTPAEALGGAPGLF